MCLCSTIATNLLPELEHIKWYRIGTTLVATPIDSRNQQEDLGKILGIVWEGTQGIQVHTPSRRWITSGSKYGRWKIPGTKESVGPATAAPALAIY